MVCEWFGLKTTRTVFAGLASKPVVTVFSGLASKPAAMVFANLASKPVAMVSLGLASKSVVTVSPSLASKLEVGFLVEPQNKGGGGFPSLGLKITATVSWFGPQNHVGFGLLVMPQNRWREVGVGHTSRSSSLLGVEANLARVSQSGLRTSGGATMGGARGTIMEVASEVR
jgi:hypothetical protein